MEDMTAHKRRHTTQPFALCKLSYIKFLQEIPVAGIIGGMYDAVYLKRTADYADMKYRLRFLEKSGPDI